MFCAGQYGLQIEPNKTYGLKYGTQLYESIVRIEINFPTMRNNFRNLDTKSMKGLIETKCLHKFETLGLIAGTTLSSVLMGNYQNTKRLNQFSILILRSRKVPSDSNAWIKTYYEFRYAVLQKDGLLSSNDDILLIYESLLLGPIGKRIPREINQWFVLQDYFDTKSQPYDRLQRFACFYWS